MPEKTMAISEKDLEQFLNDNPFLEREQELIERRRQVVESPDEAAEAWALSMYDHVTEVAENPNSEGYVAYFMLEDEFHRTAHNHFSNKLGLPPANASRAIEEYLFGDITISRQSFMYDADDPSSTYGISYVVSRAEAPL